MNRHKRQASFYPGSILRTSANWTFCLLLSLIAGACDRTTSAEHIAAGKAFWEEQRYKAAIIELKNAARKAPDDGIPRALIGQIRFELGEFDSALNNLDSARDLGVDDPRTRRTYLRVLNALGRNTQVVGALEEQSALSPDLAVILGDAYLQAGDLEKAQSQYFSGLHLARGLSGMAHLSYLNGDLAAASQYIEQAVTLEADDRKIWLLKSDIELATGNLEAALSALLIAEKLPGKIVAIQMGKARIFALKKEDDKALESLNKLTNIYKNFVPAYTMQATLHFRNGAYQKVLLALDQVPPENQSVLEIIRLRGLAHFQLKEFESASKYLSRYRKEGGKNEDATKTLAYMALQSGDPRKAIDLLRHISQAEDIASIQAIISQAHLQMGDITKAVGTLEQAIEALPNNPQLRRQLAGVLAADGDSQRAEEQLRFSLDLPEKNLKGYYLLAMLKLNQGETAESLKVAQNTIEAYPESPLGYFLRGMAQAADGQIESATKSYRRSLSSDPGYFPATKALADLAITRGALQDAFSIYREQAQAGSEQAALALIDIASTYQNSKQALSQAEAVVQQFPNSHLARLGLATLLMHDGDLDRAIDEAETGLKLGPNSPRLLVVLAEIALRQQDTTSARGRLRALTKLQNRGTTDSKIISRIAKIQLGLGNSTAAKQQYQRILAMTSTPPPEVLFNLSQLELADRNFTTAQKYAHQLANTSIPVQRLALLHADIDHAKGRTTESMQQYRRLADENYRPAFIKAAKWLLREKAYEEAAVFMGQWLRTHPQDKPVHKLIAAALIDMGKPKVAKEHYDAMLPTNDPVVLMNLALLYLSENKLGQAQKFAEQAYQNAPKNARAQDTLGWILLVRGDNQRAVELLEDSVKQDPKNGLTHYHLGMSLAKNGEAERAKTILSRSISLGGFTQMDAARAALQKLGS